MELWGTFQKLLSSIWNSKNKGFKMRDINVIARDILREWKNPNVYAMAYLKPMLQLRSIEDTYGLDDARSIVLYFLSNASGFRGSSAKLLKSELKLLLSS